jgi:RHS repeat-associated protein
MPSRSFSANSYRYGFNGKEKDDEVKGEGNSLDMGDRWLDSRLGRTSKLDVKSSMYPNLSPYSFAANNPIFFIDPDGKIIIVHYVENGVNKYYTYKPGVKPTTNNTFVQQVHEAVTSAMKNDANKTFQNLSASKESVTFNEIKTHNDETTGKINGAGSKV